MSSFVKDVFSVGFSKILVIAFSLGTGIITARWLGPEGNGIIATLAVYPSLFLTFGSLGISQSATHFIGTGKYSEQLIKTSITQIWFLTTIFSVVTSFLLIRFFSNSGNNLLWVVLSILPIPFTLFNKYNSGIFLGKNQIGVYNRINWLPKAVSFLSIALLIVVLNLNISGALMASIAGPLFMFILLLFKNQFIMAFSFQFNLEVIRSMLSLGIIYAVALLIINLNYKLDVILLDKFSTAYYTGIYSKGVAIADFLWEIPMLLSTIIFARSANAKNGIQFSYKVAQLLRVSILAIGMGTIVLFILAKYIILLMYGKEFVQSTQVIQLLLPGVLLLTIFKVLNMDLAGKGKPWISMKAMLPAVILNVVLNLILIPKYAANGAALASTISYIFAAILFLHFYSRETKISILDIFRYSRNDFLPIQQAIKKIVTRN